jgi:hypothetical protein
MSETESSEFDDEDLSAPPRNIQTPVKTSRTVKTQDVKQQDETQDEEDIQELSPSQFRSHSLKRKQEQTPPRDKKTDYAAIVRRSPNNGRYILCGV